MFLLKILSRFILPTFSCWNNNNLKSKKYIWIFLKNFNWTFVTLQFLRSPKTPVTFGHKSGMPPCPLMCDVIYGRPPMNNRQYLYYSGANDFVRNGDFDFLLFTACIFRPNVGSSFWLSGYTLTCFLVALFIIERISNIFYIKLKLLI